MGWNACLVNIALWLVQNTTTRLVIVTGHAWTAPDVSILLESWFQAESTNRSGGFGDGEDGIREGPHLINAIYEQFSTRECS